MHTPSPEQMEEKAEGRMVFVKGMSLSGSLQESLSQPAMLAEEMREKQVGETSFWNVWTLYLWNSLTYFIYLFRLLLCHSSLKTLTGLQFLLQ